MAELTRIEVIKLIACSSDGKLVLRGVDLSKIDLSNLSLAGANPALANLR
jgi:uncharacterized protein YjbI with pentapeptide repeats